MEAMKLVLDKLATLLGDEYKLLKGVRREAKFLHRELSSMTALLERLVGVELDAQTAEWGNAVRDMAYDVEDCLDVFMHCLGRGGGDANAAGLMRGVVDRLTSLRTRHQIGKQIKLLKDRVLEESHRRDRYKLGTGAFDVPRGDMGASMDPRLSAFYGEARGLVGIDGPRDKIIQQLNDGEKPLKVVSIVGFGGLGKTTLAMEIYRKIQGEFQCRASTSVSRMLDLKKLLKDILSQINPDEYRRSEPWDEQQLIRKLMDCLKDKRYLIVIDDIWSTEVWNDIKYVFTDNIHGSRVITTTRIEQVAIACCSYRHNYVYKIQHLRDEDSKKLFFKRIFDYEDACPEQLKNISEEILKKCGGVPLAIISIASLLASQKVMTKAKWEIILNSLGDMLEANPTLRWMNYVLNLSYNDLSHDLRTCMLYLVTFPEDSIIRKDRLVRRWIAEGFVVRNHGQDPEEVAEGYFTELVNRSMIQPADFSDSGDLMSCRVHDLMLDLLMSKSRRENFVATVDDLNGARGFSQVRRFSLHLNNAEEFHSLVPTNIDFRQTRSLVFSGPVQCMPPLAKFELLRVLDLDGLYSRPWCYDLDDICKFFMLRYLRIEGNSFKLPVKIRALQYLETLELRGCLLHVPLDVCELPLLSTLVVPGSAELPARISGMRALRSLGAIDISRCTVDVVRDLGELTNLRDLELCYQRNPDYGDDRELKDALMASLAKLAGSKLQSLAFSGADSWCTPVDLLGHWDSPPCHLQRLHLLKCPFYRVPAWIPCLLDLTSLKLKVERLQKDDVEVLGKLPSLVDLQLSVRVEDEKGIILICGETFPSLQIFAFFHGEPCSPYLAFEPKAMRKLRKLSLVFKRADPERKGTSPPDGIEYLSSLEKVLLYHTCDRKCNTFEGALREAISKHANRPSLEIRYVCFHDGFNWPEFCGQKPGKNEKFKK